MRIFYLKLLLFFGGITMCTRELGDPFRRDALNKPVRYLEKYKDYV